MKFKCDCCTHLLEITDFSVGKFKALSIAIFDIYSSKSGRKYKKPKSLADVVIMNNHYPKEYDKLVKFIKKHSEKRRQK